MRLFPKQLEIMRQVEYASIGGYVFSLEDEAAVATNEYLDELESFYSGKESGAEVMEGIEERMAELLLEKCGPGGVITIEMVNEVVAVLGRPETIEKESVDSSGSESAETSGASGRSASKNGGRPRRKLYRDPANGKLAGVCSGLAAYFNTDVSIFRIAFVVLTLLGGLRLGFLWYLEPWIHISVPLAYLILWICMPAVKSVRQRDEMRGQRGTVDDISSRIISTSRTESRPSRDSETLRNVWRVFEVVAGVALLLVGVAGMSFLCSFIWGAEVLGNGFFYNRLIEVISVEAPELLSFLSIPLVMVALVLVVVIPFLEMLYGGVMLIFGLKSPKWHPGLILFVIWLIILVALSVSVCMTFSVIDL